MDENGCDGEGEMSVLGKPLKRDNEEEKQESYSGDNDNDHSDLACKKLWFMKSGGGRTL